MQNSSPEPATFDPEKPTSCPEAGHSHFVQFYEGDEYLLRSLAKYVGEALLAGEGAIVIATEAHRTALAANLAIQGVNTEALETSGHYVILDAAETLSKFMVDGMPDPDRFEKVMGKILGRMAARGIPIKAFGEMVALLWEGGAGAAACQLEDLWNGLAQKFKFSLFCAYPIQSFHSERHGPEFERICRAHGHVIPTESYASPQHTPDERNRTIALLQQKAAALEAEVRDRKEAEEALRKCNEELSSFFENATIGLHWVRADGVIKWANRAEYELLGYTKEEYIGKKINDFHADADVIEDILARLSRAETIKNYEARLKCKNGTFKEVLIDSNALWDKGEFVHTQCFTRDVTEQKAAERDLLKAQDRLAEANQELEKRVEERTAKLAETVGELESFSYSLSHDMRSPLRAMIAHTQVLIDEAAPKLAENEKYSLERIRKSALRLDMLVRDVLAYSKVAQGEVTLQPIGLGSFVEDLLEEQFQANRQYLQVTGPLLAVNAHDAYLTQALSNLLTNSLKFARPGTAPEVRLWTEKTGSRVRLFVRDNGIGIRPEHRDRLFRLFGRIHPEKTYEGTGMGLCIVRKAVQRMGGTVDFISEAGEGTTFWVELQGAEANP